MSNLRDIMAFYCSTYPNKSELSKARLTKLVYLGDWFSSLLDGHQITDVRWIFNHYGPYVDDVANLAESDADFSIAPEKTIYGTDKFLISYSGATENIALNDREKDILKAVINKTKSMYFNDFIDYVYSTYPVSSNERYSTLNLPQLALNYRDENNR